MEDLRAQQIEALEVLADYNERLVKSMNGVIGELKGERKEDTDQYLEEIIKGINWEIGILNGTLSLINEGEERIQKEEMNSSILKLSKALEGKVDQDMAEAMQEALPMFEKLGKVAKEIVEKS